MRRYKSHPSYTHDMFRTKFMVSLHLLDFRASRKDINKIFIVSNTAESIWYLMKCYESTWVLNNVSNFYYFVHTLWPYNILNIMYQKDFYSKINRIIWIFQEPTLRVIHIIQYYANLFTKYMEFSYHSICRILWFLEEWNFWYCWNKIRGNAFTFYFLDIRQCIAAQILIKNTFFHPHVLFVWWHFLVDLHLCRHSF